TTDALTGLRNRRKFDDVIDAEWRRAARQATPIALLMIDADHFKAYNDSFGHQAGDQALVSIAICISDSVRRAGDCAARYGGEEFAVLLPGLAAMDALRDGAQAPDPEPRDSGFDASHRPGMTAKAQLALSPSLLQILLHLRAQGLAQIGARHAVGDVGAQEAGLRSTIMTLALEFHAIEL